MPKIVIADEGSGVATLVESALGEGGVEVLLAPTGAEAVAQVEREAPALVVSDVYLPDMDGYRVCEFVKSHPRLGSTPVLLVADVVDATVLSRAGRVRPDDVLRKPFAADQLLARIRSLLPTSPSADPSWSRPGERAEARGAMDLKDVPGQLAALAGVALSVLVDAEGFLVAGAGEMATEAEMVGAVVSLLAESSDRIGRELGHGRPRTMSIEYESGLVLLTDAGNDLTLGIVLRDAAAFQTVRRAAARALSACPRRDPLATLGAR